MLDQASTFVLKGLPQETSTSPDSLFKIRQEIFTLLSLKDCPNVVKPLTLVCFPNRFFEEEQSESEHTSSSEDSLQVKRKYSKFSMEMVEGYSLYDILRKGAIPQSVVKMLILLCAFFS